MGYLTRFFVFFAAFCGLCLPRATGAMESHETRSLDDFFEDYARDSLPKRPSTGVLYNVSLPSNFTGVEVSIVRLRSASFWAKGANYSHFDIPPSTLPEPIFTRLDLVFSNLGNWSTYYFNVPNHTLVTSVLGFHAYGSRNPSGQIGNLTTPTTKLNLTLLGDPILVGFPPPRIVKAKCVVFYSNGTSEMTDMTLSNSCAVRDQGHFAVVVWNPPPSETRKKGNKRWKLWRWWVFGFCVGVVGLLLFGIIMFFVVRFFRKRRIEKMEKQAEKNEALDTVDVGNGRMPSAFGVRTQPVLEIDDFP